MRNAGLRCSRIDSRLMDIVIDIGLIRSRPAAVDLLDAATALLPQVLSHMMRVAIF